ncbi:MFS transporter [Pseudomonas aeruginosa]
MGPAWVFLFNSFPAPALIWAIGVAARRPQRSLPPEGILEGVTAALRFTQYSTVTRLVMMRSLRLRPLCQRGLGPAAAAGAPQPGRRRGDLRLHARRPRPRRDPSAAPRSRACASGSAA